MTLDLGRKKDENKCVDGMSKKQNKMHMYIVHVHVHDL